MPQLTVNASDSVQLSGVSPDNNLISSGLFSATYGTGNAGNITINTPRLNIEGGAQVITGSYFYEDSNGIVKPATGKAGNLTVNASKSIELSGISTDGST
ncbi:MAG: filamentous hemagglutinin N-terminal domain-containing protein, partial [Nostoc sp.]